MKSEERKEWPATTVALWALAGMILFVSLAAWVYNYAPAAPSVAARAPSPAVELPSVRETPPPWPALETGQGRAGAERLLARLEAASVPYRRGPYSGPSYRLELEVFVSGRRVVVPAGVGQVAAEDLYASGVSEETDPNDYPLIAALHTQDEGVLTVEGLKTYTLGQFFDVWGVRLTSDCIGAACKDAQRRLLLLADGRPLGGNPRELVLADGFKLTLVYGDAKQLAAAARQAQESPPPSRYQGRDQAPALPPSAP